MPVGTSDIERPGPEVNQKVSIHQAFTINKYKYNSLNCLHGAHKCNTYLIPLNGQSSTGLWYLEGKCNGKLNTLLSNTLLSSYIVPHHLPYF